MSFGTNIGYLRKKKGITQEELAEQMYVSRQTISRWETDSVYPDVETVIKLCEILECDMETLVRGDATRMDEQAPHEHEHEDEREDENGAGKIEANFELDVNRGDVLRIINALLFPLATVAFLLLGFIWDLWHPGWLAFVVATFLSSLIRAIRPIGKAKKQKPKSLSGLDWDSLNAAFCAIVFLIAIPAYLVMGFMWNLWHPGWLIFVAAAMSCGISSVLCSLVFDKLDRKKE